MQKQPTINLNIRPRNEPPSLTTKQHHRARQILRIPDPQWALLQPQSPERLLALTPTQPRIHDTRTDTINPDAVPDPLARHRARQVVHARFGDGVRGVRLGLIDDVA